MLALTRLACTFAAVLVPLGIAQAQTPTIKVKICRIAGISPEVSDALADENLKVASETMAANGYPVQFVRDGTVDEFQSASGGTIQANCNHYGTYNGLNPYINYNVRVLRSIQCCGGFSLACAGCSDVGTNPRRMAINVVPYGAGYAANLNGLTWLHEFGHNCNLNHVSYANAVMSGDFMTGSSTVLTNSEAAAIYNSVVAIQQSQAQVAGGQAAAPLAPAPPGAGGNQVQAPGPQGKIDVRQFVHAGFSHGVPYDYVVKNYNAEDARALIPLLDDPKEKPFLEAIVTTLCYIGSPESVQPLLDHYKKDRAQLSDSEFRARGALLANLGVLAHKSKSNEALGFLIDSVSDTGQLQRRAAWTPPPGMTTEAAEQTLATSALVGISHTGRDEATAKLNAIQANAPHPTLRSNAAAAIGRNEAIKINGISKYLEKSIQ